MKIRLTARLMLTEERGEIELNEGALVDEVVGYIGTKHPELGEMKNLLITINGKRSGRTAPLSDGDELELILLMGGG